MESEGNDFFSGKYEKNSYMMMLMRLLRLLRLSAVFSHPYVNYVMALMFIVCGVDGLMFCC